jgi:hypothetical protein
MVLLEVRLVCIRRKRQNEEQRKKKEKENRGLDQ